VEGSSCAAVDRSHPDHVIGERAFSRIPSHGMAQGQQESIRAEIDEINAAIAREGAEWVAGETSVLRLSQAERQSRLGLLPTVIMEDEMVIEEFLPMAHPLISTGGKTAKLRDSHSRSKQLRKLLGLRSYCCARISHPPRSGNAGCQFESLRTDSGVLQWSWKLRRREHWDCVEFY